MDQPAAKDSQSLRQRRRRQDYPGRGHGLLTGKRYSRRSKLLLLGLGLSWMLIFFLVLFFSVKLYRLQQDNRALHLALQESETAREPLAGEVARLQAAVEDLLADRLPGLSKITLDEVIPLRQGYLKNVLFSRISGESGVDYEYRLVLENDSFFRVWPKVNLYFFDEFGIQLGTARIGPEQVRETGNDSSLAPGESRSFSGLLEFTEERLPHYFRTRLESRPAPESGKLSGPSGEVDGTAE